MNIKIFVTGLLLALLVGLAACGTAEETEDVVHEEIAPEEILEAEIYEEEIIEEAYEPDMSDIAEASPAPEIEITVLDFNNYEEEMVARNHLFAELSALERYNPERIEEMENLTMFFGDVRMRFTYEIRGEAPENGHALFIALHGGGGVPQFVNEQQFQHMQIYYRDSVQEGIYVAVRGVRDTWNTHFNYESFPLYDRLIENMILFYDIDPNRVYLLGFSAGGDGVYGITPRMADRFAAVSMSAGHHNWVNPINFKHTPIILQCGDSDTAFYRHIETVNFGEVMRDLGYTFALNMHVNMPHNFFDNVPASAPQRVWADPFAWRDGEASDIIEIDTNSVRFLKQFTREPLPDEIAWHLGTRADMRSVESFYWLRAGFDVNDGVIRALLDRDANAISIQTDEYVSGAFYILLNRQMVDFDTPVILDVNGNISEVAVTSSADILLETTIERLDPNFQFTAMIRIEV